MVRLGTVGKEKALYIRDGGGGGGVVDLKFKDKE
jgi:hypothetical protein